jgi:hypothetical protein
MTNSGACRLAPFFYKVFIRKGFVRAMARHKSPPGAVLLQRLKGLESKPSKGLSLMLISITSLPTSDTETEFWGDLDDFLIEFKARYEAELYELSLADWALLAKMS